VPREIVAGMHVAVRPDGLTDVVRLIVPVKPFTLATVIVTVAEEPTVKLTLVGLAVMVKSCTPLTVKTTVAEWDREPLVPVTVTVTEPVEAKVQESVEVSEPPVTDEGVRLHAELSLVRATSPVNPLTGEMVMVDVPARPTVTVTVVGLAAMVKSGRLVIV